MNNKLSKKLNSFPKHYQLSHEAKLKIEDTLHEEIQKMETGVKRKSLKEFLRKLSIPLSGVSVIAIVSLLLINSESFPFFQKSVEGPSGEDSNHELTGEPMNSAEDMKKMNELSNVWAQALQTRDGKPRYEMMSKKAKDQFEQEQIDRSGEDWNFNIGFSSPWVVNFDIEIEGVTANIVYTMETSEPATYYMKETLAFVKENGQLLVDEYHNLNDLYIGHISIERDTLYLDKIEWITNGNQDRIKELGLSQSEMPNGYYIYNPRLDKISFEIGESTEYNFVAFESLSFIKEGEDRNYSTTKKEEFMEFLNYTKPDRVVFWVEIKDGFVVSITEQFTN